MAAATFAFGKGGEDIPHHCEQPVRKEKSVEINTGLLEEDQMPADFRPKPPTEDLDL